MKKAVLFIALFCAVLALGAGEKRISDLFCVEAVSVSDDDGSFSVAITGTLYSEDGEEKKQLCASEIDCRDALDRLQGKTDAELFFGYNKMVLFDASLTAARRAAAARELCDGEHSLANDFAAVCMAPETVLSSEELGEYAATDAKSAQYRLYRLASAKAEHLVAYRGDEGEVCFQKVNGSGNKD